MNDKVKCQSWDAKMSKVKGETSNDPTLPTQETLPVTQIPEKVERRSLHI